MYNSLPCIKIVLLVLLAVLHHSTTAYIGQITWDWDDAGSGNEDQEQAAIPIYEKSWVTPPFLLVGESLKGNDYDEPLSRSERVSEFVYLQIPLFSPVLYYLETNRLNSLKTSN